jgi:excisionase family DNA binding protein
MASLSATGTQRPRLTRDDVLDAQEVAELLHMPLSTVLDLARRGVLPGHKLGRRWIFLHDELELGLRHAPSRNGPQTRQQPPAREAAGPPRPRSKRYPGAVPYSDQPAQPHLFS